MKSENPLIQIAVRAFWINFWLFLITLFLILTKPTGYTVTSDIPRQLVVSLIISIVVQTFKKPNQSNAKHGLTEYQQKYRRLLNMVGGDKSTCDGLISAYGIDRAIQDLIRDRQ